MHTIELSQWQHEHDYLPHGHRHSERQTRRVIALTAVMMVVEILAGTAWGSMALLADGWHMASHASALSITAFAYWYARRHAGNPEYTFGTGKVSVLGGFTSAVVLGVISISIAWESITRLVQPVPIRFDEAIVVAFLGLAVNLVSAWMLRGDHHHGGHAHSHDHNLRAAYLHVLADALTSTTAIVALTAGKYAGWVWMDPVMGVVGSIVIARWSLGLIRDTSSILLDCSVDEERETQLAREAIEADGDARVADIHLWRMGPAHLAAAISVVAHHPRSPDHYRGRLLKAVPLSHVTIEVHDCGDG
ncbi:MAG: CDF family Co(II)/Ni(II) efflux transporter DmeF [Myxococcota bacterium]